MSVVSDPVHRDSVVFTCISLRPHIRTRRNNILFTASATTRWWWRTWQRKHLSQPPRSSSRHPPPTHLSPFPSLPLRPSLSVPPLTHSLSRSASLALDFFSLVGIDDIAHMPQKKLPAQIFARGKFGGACGGCGGGFIPTVSS
jgi:hypothetical protein